MKIRVSNRVFIYLLLFIFSLLPAYSFSTDHAEVQYDNSDITVRSPDDQFLEKYKSDRDFDYLKNVRETTNYFGLLLNRFFRRISLFLGSGDAFSLIIYAVFVVLIVLLIIKLTNTRISAIFYKNRQNNRIHVTEGKDDIEEDIDDLLKKEILNRKFRQAVRLSYLKVLKILDELKLINWRIDKTNTDYYWELDSTAFQKQFAELTRVYDLYCYGNFPLDESSFKTAYNQFQMFYNLVSENE